MSNNIGWGQGWVSATQEADTIPKTAFGETNVASNTAFVQTTCQITQINQR